MFELLMLWVLSPIVLLIIILVQSSKISSLKSEVTKLKKQLEFAQASLNADPSARQPAATYSSPQMDPLDAAPLSSPLSSGVDSTAAAPGIVLSSSLSPGAGSTVAAPGVVLSSPLSSDAGASEGEQIVASTSDAPVSTAKLRASAPSFRSRATSLNVLLSLGAIFVSLAGLVFATSSWGVLSNLMRILLICAMSVVFFGFSFVAKKIVKLEETAKAFFVLGTVFIPVSFVAFGYFQLFGPYFSLHGKGVYLLFSIAALLAALACAGGWWWYGSSLLAWGALCSASACIILFLLNLRLSLDVLTLALSVHSVLVYFILRYALAHLWFPSDVEQRILEPFALLHTLLLGLFVLFVAPLGLFSALGTLFLAALFLLRPFYKHPSAEYGSVLLFTLFLTAGFLRLSNEFFLDRSAMLLALVTLVFFLLKFLGLYGDSKLSALFGKIGFLFAFLTLGSNVFAFTTLLHWTLPLVISLVLLTAMVTYEGLFLQQKHFLQAQSVFVLCLMTALMDLWKTPHAFLAPLAFAALCTVFGIGYDFIRLPRNGSVLGTWPSAILFGLGTLAQGLVLHQQGAFISELLVLALLLIAVSYHALQKEDSLFQKAFAFCMPYPLLFSAFPMMELVASQNPPFWLFYTAYLLVASTLLLLPFSKLRRLDLPFGLGAIPGGCAFWLLDYASLWLPVSTHENSYLFVGPFFLFTLLWLFFVMNHWRKSPLSTRVHLYLSGFMGILASFSVGLRLGQSPSFALQIYTALCAASVFAALYALLYVKLANTPALAEDTRSSVFYLALTSNLLLLLGTTFWFTTEGNFPWWMAMFPLVNGLVVYLLSFPRARLCLLGCVPALCFYPLLLQGFWYAFPARMTLAAENFLLLGIFVLYAALGRLHRGPLWHTKAGAFSPKPLVFAAVATPLLLYTQPHPWSWIASFVLSVWMLLLLQQKMHEDYNRSVLSVAVLPLCWGFWTQRVFAWPSILATELKLLPLVLLSVYYRFVLWKKHEHFMHNAQFAVAVLCSLWLFAEVVLLSRMMDAVILAALELALLLGSIFYRRRSYLTLGCAMLLMVMFYSTRDFWQNLAWWVYLLLIGVFLISLAATSEYRKKRNLPFKNPLEFIKNWAW